MSFPRRQDLAAIFSAMKAPLRTKTAHRLYLYSMLRGSSQATAIGYQEPHEWRRRSFGGRSQQLCMSCLAASGVKNLAGIAVMEWKARDVRFVERWCEWRALQNGAAEVEYTLG